MLIEAKSEEDDAPVNMHYAWIKNCNRFLSHQNKHNGATYFCTNCLHGYSREELLIRHSPECRGNSERAIRIEMPTEKNKIVKFENYRKQQKVPWVIYSDLEAVVVKNTNVDTSKATQKISTHQVCGFSLQPVRSDGETKEQIIYRGTDAMPRFFEELERLEHEILEEMKKPKSMAPLTQDQKKQFKNAETCWIYETGGFDNGNKKVCYEQSPVHKACKPEDAPHEQVNPDLWQEFFEAKECMMCDKKFTNRHKVRDHCHLTGKYRGAAHADCNLKLRIKPSNKEFFIPVVFHNLRGYDSHLIMQAISETEGEIKCIPNNMEKYISFSLRQLRFIDSNQFLIASLDELVKSNSKSVFKITKNSEFDKSKRNLLLQKGVYPYEYMDSWERFKETKLPPRRAFYSTLTESGITRNAYDHAQKVWDVFNCANLGDYHDLYLKTDTLLLADVFQQFRTKCFEVYKLDPVITILARA